MRFRSVEGARSGVQFLRAVRLLARARQRGVARLLLAVALGALPLPARAEGSPGERARGLARDGHLEQALGVYDAWLEQAPKDRDAQLGRARVLGWMRRYAEAEDQVARTLALAPGDVEAYLVLGDLHAWQQRPADAERCYADAARLAPEDLRPALRLGRALRQQGRYEEARAAFEQALAIDPGSPEALAALLPPERARRFRLDANFQYDSLDDGDWWHQQVQLAYRVAEALSLSAGVEQYRRFDENDTQWTLGGTLSLPRGWILDSRLALGMNVDVVARTVVDVDLSRRFGERWSAGLHFRHSRFPGDVQSNLISQQLELAPFAQGWMLLRYSLTRVSGGGTGHAGTLRMGLFPGARLSPDFGVSYGSEAFAASSVGGQRSHARVFAASTGLVWRLREHLGLRLGFEYEKLRHTYERRGLATGLYARF